MKDLRKFHSLAAMSLLPALLAEKEAAIKSAKDSGLSTHTFSVLGVLRECAALKGARILPIDLQRDRSAPRPLPNAVVNANEQHRAAVANGGAMRTPKG